MIHIDPFLSNALDSPATTSDVSPHPPRSSASPPAVCPSRCARRSSRPRPTVDGAIKLTGAKRREGESGIIIVNMDDYQ